MSPMLFVGICRNVFFSCNQYYKEVPLLLKCVYGIKYLQNTKQKSEDKICPYKAEANDCMQITEQTTYFY